MKDFLKWVERMIKGMGIVAGVSVSFIVLLTVTDMFLRIFKKPILGTYEIVGLCCGVMVCFALPYTSWIKAHIIVDILVDRFPKKIKNITRVITRGAGIALFLVAGLNLLKVGADLKKAGEVTATLEIPFCVIAFVIGICCFVECVVLFSDILRIQEGRQHE